MRPDAENSPSELRYLDPEMKYWVERRVERFHNGLTMHLLAVVKTKGGRFTPECLDEAYNRETRDNISVIPNVRYKLENGSHPIWTKTINYHDNLQSEALEIAKHNLDEISKPKTIELAEQRVLRKKKKASIQDLLGELSLVLGSILIAAIPQELLQAVLQSPPIQPSITGLHILLTLLGLFFIAIKFLI
jgi:hypothetical protein